MLDLSIKEIDRLRKLLKRARKPAPVPTAERNAARKAQRDAYRAEVLDWGIRRWDAAAARLRASHGPLCPVELGIGQRPERFTPSLADHYQRRQSLD